MNLRSRISSLYLHYRRVFRIFRGFGMPSYDGRNSKSKLTQAMDYLYIFFVLKIMPNNYHLFRFDSKDRTQFKDYLGDSTEPLYYRKLRMNLWSGALLVHDKYLFKCICRCHDLPVPLHFAMIKNNKIDGGGSDMRSFMLEKRLNRVIVKPVMGGGGRGIHLITIDEAKDTAQLEALDARFGGFMKEGYLVEEVIEQHPELNRINPNTVNSIRIVTILCRDASVEFLAAMLKTSSTNVAMDNFSQGGIVIGIDLDTGKLKEDGTMQYPQGRVFKRHPLTQTEFLGFQIPFWEELIKIVTKAQQVFYHIKSVGWDIAMTPKGPLFIEGNQDWGSNGLQAANGGLLTPKNKALFAQYGITFYD